jgi:uncharacterized protein YdeI (YjbR/CyaY-like superfamily)
MKLVYFASPAEWRGWIDGIRRSVYAYEQRRNASLGPAFDKLLMADAAARKYFQVQPPWYRRTASWWVISAKKEETRLKRVGILIAFCAAGRTIGPLTPK